MGVSVPSLLIESTDSAMANFKLMYFDLISSVHVTIDCGNVT